ncbi:hypothetical protein [Larkinella arboricola]
MSCSKQKWPSFRYSAWSELYSALKKDRQCQSNHTNAQVRFRRLSNPKAV